MEEGVAVMLGAMVGVDTGMREEVAVGGRPEQPMVRARASARRRVRIGVMAWGSVSWRGEGLEHIG